MKTNEAIILAGGFGTRLKDLLPGIPKCMAPVNGEPFLTYVLTYLEQQKINKVILSVGYLKDHIINYFGNKYRTLTIEYAIENEPLGTGGAIKFAMEQCAQDQVFVINGDTYFNVDLESMQNMHNKSAADITIAVKQLDDSSRYGLVETDVSGRITAFKEKEIIKGRIWINGGIYLVNKQAFKNISENKFSLENDIFKVSCSSLKLQSFESTEPFLDMGIPEDYLRAQALLSQYKTS
jgi:D-glycero-alpha-D-manno-heptose 1-phosphate guanylyltransferase